MRLDDLVTTLLTGGTIGTLASWAQQVRRDHRRTKELVDDAPDRKADASLQRAQAALVVMQGALDATAKRAESAEAARDAAERREAEKDALVTRLRQELEEMQEKVTAALDQLAALQQPQATP